VHTTLNRNRDNAFATRNIAAEFIVTNGRLGEMARCQFEQNSNEQEKHSHKNEHNNSSAAMKMKAPSPNTER
jgi:hypothetical protein